MIGQATPPHTHGWYRACKKGTKKEMGTQVGPKRRGDVRERAKACSEVVMV